MKTPVALFMKGPRMIVLVIAVLALVAAAGLGRYQRAKDQVRVTGQLKPEDVRDIQRAISRVRWSTARACLAKHQFRGFFDFCAKDVVVGRPLEISWRLGPRGEMAHVVGPTARYQACTTQTDGKSLLSVYANERGLLTTRWRRTAAPLLRSTVGCNPDAHLTLPQPACRATVAQLLSGGSNSSAMRRPG